MFKKLENILRIRKLSLLILLILIIPSFSSLVRPGFYSMQDDLQAFRLYEMNKCFSDFQLPCRWVPDAGYGYGYPLFNFYAPGVYYLGELFYLVGFQFIDIVKILIILGFIFSALAMYILVNELFGSFTAVVVSVLYTYAPFKAQEVYVRGAISEFWVLVFYPLLFWASYKLIKSNRKKYFVFSSILTGLLLITHNLLSIVFLPVLSIWIMFWLFILNKLKMSYLVFLSLLLGFGLAAFFLLPVIFEKQYVHVETLLGGYFDYRQHFVSLKQIFFSNTWGFGSSMLGPNDDLSLNSGLILLWGSVATLLFYLISFNKNNKLFRLVVTLSLIELITLFMMHAKSAIFWENVFFLKWLQFPWRLLSVSIFLLSFVVGCGLALFKKWKFVIGVTLVILVLLSHGSFFHPKDWINITDTQKFTGLLWQKQLTISIFDYLPIYAKLPPNSVAPDLPEVLSGIVNFDSFVKGSDYQIAKVDVLDPASVRVPLYDFPGMAVKIDGQKVVHTRNCDNQEPCLGLVTFDVPTGSHEIKVQLANTFVRSVGNLISLLSFMIVLILILKVRYEKSK